MNEIIIIGAGPAGLTAAIELQKKGCKNITIIESDVQVGGISKTINHNNNRIDIGGHRFFSKSDWVMDWWTSLMPIEKSENSLPLNIKYRGRTRSDIKPGNVDSQNNNTLLIRNRLSRIYFNRNFFDYPLKLNISSLNKLGIKKTLSFGLSYLYSSINKIKPEKSLEDFLTNRFGRQLFQQFFKEYTEKVWGVPCSEISPEWGAQRIKSLSISRAILHALKKSMGGNVDNQSTQTSLIENFLYPKLGPGQMWELAAKKFVEDGGRLKTKCTVSQINIDRGQVKSLVYVDQNDNSHELMCSHVISTMPIKDLINASKDYWSDEIAEIASNLQYRDFITVGLLYKKTELRSNLKDNWIYIQEPGVNVGRVQIFNNWSPYMVSNNDMAWLGLEFFCKDSDPLWHLSDEELQTLAQKEMFEIGLTIAPNATDSVAIKVPKAYPGYFGNSYQKFNMLREELDTIENLFLVGRNGMHRYNNQDHSMLTAAEAAKQISTGHINKKLIWDINVDDEYHEELSKKNI